MPVYKVSEAQQRVLDRMGDGARLVQYRREAPHLVQPGFARQTVPTKTVEGLIASLTLRKLPDSTDAKTEWVIVPERVYNQTRICPACNRGIYTKQTGPRSFKCLACQHAWTEERR